MEEFLDASPADLRAAARAWAWRHRTEHALAYTGAWYSEALRRTDRLPDPKQAIEDILGGGPAPRKPMTPDQMAVYFKMLQVATGGRDLRKKKAVG